MSGSHPGFWSKMMSVINVFKYGVASALRELEISGDMITVSVLMEHAEKPVALALIADDVPITYVRVMSNPGLALYEPDGKIYGKAVVSGVRLAYSLSDTPRLECARSGKVLAVLPQIRALSESPNQTARQVSVRDLILELDNTHVCSMGELGPYAVKYYRCAGKARFIDAVYQMFLKRRPEDGVALAKSFNEEMLEQSLVEYMQETYDSGEAKKLYINRIPGPCSVDFKFRI